MDHTVEHDGKLPTDVFAGDPVEELGAFAVKRDRHCRLVVLVDPNLGFLQPVPCQERLLVKQNRLFHDLADLIFTLFVEDLRSLRQIARECLLEIVGVGVDELELKSTRGLDERNGFLRILYARKLECDLVLLLFVDGWLCHAVLVHPPAGPFKGLRHSPFLESLHLSGLEAVDQLSLCSRFEIKNGVTFLDKFLNLFFKRLLELCGNVLTYSAERNRE